VGKAEDNKRRVEDNSWGEKKAKDNLRREESCGKLGSGES
jgi:hypothetical protein